MFLPEAYGESKTTFYTGRRLSIRLCFGAEKDDIGAENPYFLDIKTE